MRAFPPQNEIKSSAQMAVEAQALGSQSKFVMDLPHGIRVPEKPSLFASVVPLGDEDFALSLTLERSCAAKVSPTEIFRSAPAAIWSLAVSFRQDPLRWTAFRQKAGIE
jgi:hypothetical protein